MPAKPTPLPQIGPTVAITLNCHECVHCFSKRYTCQGDSGSDVYCRAMSGKPIGDTTWRTPDWCPFRAEAIAKVVEQAREASRPALSPEPGGTP